jgi:hypothetical protein
MYLVFSKHGLKFMVFSNNQLVIIGSINYYEYIFHLIQNQMIQK